MEYKPPKVSIDINHLRLIIMEEIALGLIDKKNTKRKRASGVKSKRERNELKKN